MVGFTICFLLLDASMRNRLKKILINKPLLLPSVVILLYIAMIVTFLLMAPVAGDIKTRYKNGFMDVCFCGLYREIKR